MSSLTDRQRRILAFERQWWKRDVGQVPELFGCSRLAYAVELAGIVVLPEALSYDPLLVRRLRRAAVVRQPQEQLG